jgi:hypothetical protein
MNNAKCLFNEDIDHHKYHGSSQVAKIKRMKSAHAIFFRTFLVSDFSPWWKCNHFIR